MILHSPVIKDFITQEVYEIINKLHNLGFTLIADSTIFMNLKLNVTMKWIDAIIIRKNECDESIYEQHLFNQNLFNTYYSEGKVLIFEDIPSENDIEMINELTCLFVPKENKDEN